MRLRARPLAVCAPLRSHAPAAPLAARRASDWTEQMAVVRVQVVTRGRDTFIKLLRADSGKLVAVAPVRPGGPSAIEQVTDSSRYFALRVENANGAGPFFLSSFFYAPFCAPACVRGVSPRSQY